MTTEIPRTIQLISVALSIAALAIIPGSELAAAPRDIHSQLTAQRETASPQSWTWMNSHPSQAGFCTPNISNATTFNEYHYGTISLCINGCQSEYTREISDCINNHKRCIKEGNRTAKHCNVNYRICEGPAARRAQSCRELITQ